MKNFILVSKAVSPSQIIHKEKQVKLKGGVQVIKACNQTFQEGG